MALDLASVILSVHVAGAIAWVVGLFVLGIVAVRLSRNRTAEPIANARRIGRFSRRMMWILWPILGLVIATGLYNVSWYLPGGFSSFSYPSLLGVQWLLAKMALVFFLVVLAAMHSFYVGPRVRHAVEAGAPDSELRGLRRMNGILGGAALLVSLLVIVFAFAVLPQFAAVSP